MADAPDPVTPDSVGVGLHAALLKALPVPVLVQGEDFRVVTANDAFAALVGYGIDELIGRDVLFMHHPADRERTLESRRLLRDAGRPPEEFERRTVAKDGTILRLRIQTSVLNGPDGRLLVLVVQDVEREHRRAQLWLDRVELFRVFFEDSPVPTTVENDQFRIVHANPAFCRWTGYSLEELIGTDPMSLHAPSTHPRMTQFRAQLLTGEADERAHAYRELRHRDGRVMRYRLHFRELTDASGRRFFVVVMLDVTREIRAQELLRRQSERFIRAFEDAPVGMLVRDVSHKVVRVNTAFSQLTGLAPESIIGRPFVLESPNPASDWVDPVGGAEGIDHRRFRLRVRSDRDIWVDAVSRRIPNFGGEPVSLTVVKDVSRELALHQELQDMVLQQSVLLRSMNAGLAHVVGDIVVQINPVLPVMLGRPAEAILGQPYESLFGDEDFWPQVARAARPSLDNDRAYRREVAMAGEDGQSRFYDMSLRRVDSRRREMGLIITLSDVTDHHQQAEQLQRALLDLEALIDNEAVGIAYLDAGQIVRCNRRLANMVGGDANSLRGQPFDRYCGIPGADVRRLAGREAVSLTTVCPVRRPDGSLLKCMVHVGPVDILRPGASIVVVIDVSEREEALSRAQTTQARFDAFASLINDAVFVMDLDERRGLMANRCFETLLGVSVTDFRSDPSRAWAHVTKQGREALEHSMSQAAMGRQQELEVDVAHPSAGMRRLRVRMFCDERPERELYVLAEDVSEYRRLERQRLDDAVKQRDLLVREVHHRIKNNLQGVAGLLQQTASRRPEVAQVLSEVAAQIHAIAQIHGLQGRAGELLSPARILIAICESLGAMFGQEILVEVSEPDCRAWGVPEQEAVPLALVINELTTNALKHRRGEQSVRVSLNATENRLSLRIMNPGELPPGFDFDRHLPSPTGLGLVKALLPRRGTRIGFENRQGIVEAWLTLGHPAVLRRTDPDPADPPRSRGTPSAVA